MDDPSSLYIYSIKDMSSIGTIMQKSSKLPNNILDVGEVYSDYKVRLVKDVREALGVMAGDKLVWIKVDCGCFVAKRVIDDSSS